METGKAIKNLLLTGRPGVGKTTLMERIVRDLKVPVGGFLTHEIRERGVRAGFQLKTWEGKCGVLSHVKISSPFRVGKYGVDVRILDEIGVPAIMDAVQNARLIAVDEVGRMELFSDLFREAVLAALESKRPFLGVIQERADPFLDRIRVRPDVQLFSVTLQNRDTLARILKDRIHDLI